MTHTELENELISLNRKIEVLKMLIDKPQCSCFTYNDAQFTASNLQDLNIYQARKQYLLSVKDESDMVLSTLVSHPIDKVCVA